MSAIKIYSKHLASKKAIERILDDLKDSVIRELNRMPDGKAAVNGIEFHKTIKTTRRYPKDIREIIENLQSQIDEQKKVAEEAGKVTISETPTFDASIPKAIEKDVFSKIPAYKKYFGIK